MATSWVRCGVVGLVRIELTTSALSVLRSNRLSYSPGGGPRYFTDTLLQNAGMRQLQSFTVNDWLAVASKVPFSDQR